MSTAVNLSFANSGSAAPDAPLWFSGLGEGSRVGLVSPSTACSDAEILSVENWLKEKGLEPVYKSPVSFGAEGADFFDDELRAAQLYSMLADDSLDAVWALRGGYGCLRMLPFMSVWPIPRKIKLVCGYSDFTVVLNFIAKQWGWVTMHAAVLKQLAENFLSAASEDKTLEAVSEKAIFWELPALVALNKTAADGKDTFSGITTGGCLSLVASLIGTAGCLDTEEKILLLEDIDESGYRIDRMLTQLRLSGIASKANAVILGEFAGYDAEETRKNNPGFYQDQQNALINFATMMERENVPVYSSPYFGHSTKMLPVPIGSKGYIDAKNKTLKVYRPK